MAPRLVERLAEYHGVPADRILVGAGTTELISLVSNALRDELLTRPGRPATYDRPVSHLVEPTDGEYKRACAQNGLRTKVWEQRNARLEPGFQLPRRARHRLDLQPEQPDRPRLGPRTGSSIDRPFARRIHGRRRGLPLVLAGRGRAHRGPRPVVDREQLIVMRSMTKIYAIPGLRIGYLIAAPAIVARLRRCLQPWTVTTAAEYAALRVD